MPRSSLERDAGGTCGPYRLLELSAFFSPALTTIQQDQHRVAKIAVAEIIQIIESGWQGLDPVPLKPIILPPSLIVRESSLRVEEGGDAPENLENK